MAELTCYDCIHCGRCNDIEGGYSCHCSDVSKCKHFKSKADFVEVVRCEKCKYRKTHTCAITGTKTLFCDYGEKPVVVEPTHYCGRGERRDT